MNPIAMRLLNQQLANKQFASPAEVVSHMATHFRIRLQLDARTLCLKKQYIVV